MVDAYTDIGCAKLDISREERTGNAEVIYGPGKTNEQLLAIMRTMREKNCPLLVTRVSAEQAAFVKLNGEDAVYDEMSKTLTRLVQNAPRPQLNGRIAVCTGGTADIPVAEEAAKVAEFWGARVERFYDVGITGLHRLLNKVEEIRHANVVIAVAGMEGALPTVVAGLVKAPVIGVPTSVGYGASFNGLNALLTMINSCAEGVTVVNIDNGFGAAAMACRILRQREDVNG